MHGETFPADGVMNLFLTENTEKRVAILNFMAAKRATFFARKRLAQDKFVHKKSWDPLKTRGVFVRVYQPTLVLTVDNVNFY